MSGSHNHHHAVSSAQPGSHRRRLAIAFALTFAILVAQAVGSVITGSLALLTDTVHMLTDVLGLLVALLAAMLMTRPADSRRTWGYRRIEVLAALAQATLLLVIGTFAAIEGVKRLFEPPEVPAGELLIFGVIGLAANIISMLVLMGGRGANLNMRAAFLEVANDALGSVGVIVAAVVIWTTGFQQADAVAGLFIAALIVPRAFILMRDTVRILMAYAPQGLDLDELRDHIGDLEHVEDVHDIHATTIGSGLPILTAHVVVSDECFADGHAEEVLESVRECVAEHFPVSIQHSTIQVETASMWAKEPAQSGCSVARG